MKLKYFLPLAVALPAMLASCSDDDEVLGNPVFNYTDASETAHFGDSLEFTINASDAEVPLSTLKAQLFFGDEMVEQTVIRTKVSGADYTGKIYIPYFANVPDGTATLKVVLQNINFTVSEKEYPVRITHPDFPYLTLRTEEGQEYRMEKTGADLYSVSERFPQKFKGYIIAPKVGENGNELTFGYENSAVVIGAEGAIPFSSAKGGRFAVELNTRTFEAAPFTVLKLNGMELTSIDDNTASTDLTLSTGDVITPEGFSNFGQWWIDPDYFTRNDDGSLSFTAKSGQYRIIADQKMQYFRVQVLQGGSPASFQADGTGAIWAIGEGFGKPSLANAPGWTTEAAVCLAPVADKVYQLTLVGGKTIKTSGINFKFFGEALGWGNEFDDAKLTTSSPLIQIGAGTDVNGHDKGNLFIPDGVTLKDNEIYVLTIDCNATPAVLTVTEAGEQPFEEIPVFCNGIKMTTGDNAVYTLVTDLAQNSTVAFDTLDGLEEYFFDPDFMSYDSDNDVITFLPVSGHYQITVNKLAKTVGAQRFDGNSPATLKEDGTGAIYMMGWGAGSPSLDSQFGWDTGNAYGLAEISPKVYRFTGYAGPEKGSETGQRLRTDYISVKFFHQKGWGGEFNPSQNTGLTIAAGSEKLIKANPDGNIELAAGATLEEGALYELTIDLSKGNNSGTISLIKK